MSSNIITKDTDNLLSTNLGVAAGHISNSHYKNMNHDISKAKKLLLQLFWSGSLNWQITSQPKILQPFK
jgi:hypothetical protein